jgi:hypothetical protein
MSRKIIKTFEGFGATEKFMPYTGPTPPFKVFARDQFVEFYNYLDERLTALHEDMGEPIPCTWWFYSLAKGSKGPGYPHNPHMKESGALSYGANEQWKRLVRPGQAVYLFDMVAAQPGRNVMDLLRIVIVDESGSVVMAARNDDHNPNWYYTGDNRFGIDFRKEMQGMVDAAIGG